MQQSGGLLLTPVQTLVATLIYESRWRARCFAFSRRLPRLASKPRNDKKEFQFHMVGIVQLAEHRIVVPGVVGSSPITHPIKTGDIFGYLLFLYGFGL